MSGETLSGGTVSIPVKPDAKGFGAKLAEDVHGESGGLHEVGAQLGETLMKGLEVVGIAVGVGEFIKKGVEEYSAADALNAQFSAGIKSTGNAAGLSVKGMDDLAASISGYSGQAYDSIGKTEQVLQTFTNIKNVGPNKIFDDATTAAANMAAKLGGDASSSAIQLGKALNDPVKGMASLRRVGVAFTADQQAQVKAMVASGDTMGAQKLILGELSKEFGGAAKAAGETLPGEINRSKVAFGELTKAIVSGIMPAVTPAIAGVADLMNGLTPHIEAFSEHVSSVFEWMKQDLSGMDPEANVGKLAKPLREIDNVILNVGIGFRNTAKMFAPVIGEIGGVFRQLVPVFAPLIPQVLQVATAFSPVSLIFHALLPVIPQLVGVLASLVGVVGTQFAGVLRVLLPILSSVVKMLTGDLAGIFKQLMPIVAQVAQVLGVVLGTVLVQLTPVITLVAGQGGRLLLIMQPLIGAVMSLVAAILPLLPPLLLLAGQILGVVISLFVQLLPPILKLVQALLSMLMPILTVLIQALAAILPPVLRALMPIISSVASIFGDVLTPAIHALTSILGGVINFITGVFTGNWSQAWNGIVQIFSGIWNGLTGIVKGVMNGIIDGVNGAIGSINSIGGAVGVHIGTIPHLAEGATILPTPGGTVVRVGEGGKSESVVDTGKLNKLLDQANTGGTGRGNTFIINEATNATAVAQAVLHHQAAMAV